MPLVNPVDITDEKVKELVNFFNETLGFCPNSVLTMQRRPAIAKAFVELNMAVMQNQQTTSNGATSKTGGGVTPYDNSSDFETYLITALNDSLIKKSKYTYL